MYKQSNCIEVKLINSYRIGKLLLITCFSIHENSLNFIKVFSEKTQSNLL